MKKTIAVILILLSFLVSLQAQTIIGVVDYMKVDNHNEYLEVEKVWQKIHEQRLKEGMIVGWAMYQVMFKTVEDPYNFITISWYDSFSKLDKEIPQSIIKSALPTWTDEKWDDFIYRTSKSRKLISSSVFHQRMTCANGLDKLGKIYVINEISIKQGKSKDYLQICEEIYKALYEEDILNKKRTNWSLWEKWPGNMKDFQYLAADGYSSLEQIDHSNFLGYFEKIHPDKNIDEISKQVEELRTLVNTEMWKLVYRIVK